MGQEIPTRASLLVRLRESSDDEAWTQFVQIYTPLIYGFCIQRGVQQTDAADVTQEVLKSVASAMHRFEYNPQRSSFRNWLFTVVRSKVHNFIRSQLRQPARADLVRGEVEAEGTEASEVPDPSSTESWEREYRVHLFHWAASKIRTEFSEATWNAFWRTAVENEKAEEVAQELRISLNAIYIARSRITKRLKEMLDTIGDEEDPHIAAPPLNG